MSDKRTLTRSQGNRLVKFSCVRDFDSLNTCFVKLYSNFSKTERNTIKFVTMLSLTAKVLTKKGLFSSAGLIS